MKMKLEDIKKLVAEADAIIIGGGSGLSTSAGVKMDGDKFQKEFKPWIDKYKIKDLYTASFYNFKTPEEKWAFWGKYIRFIDIDREGTDLYRKIYNLVKDKNYFVVTTNTDDQFYKTGFDKNKIFRTQGSYRLLQCSTPCHDKLYDADEISRKLVENTDKDLKVPSNFVPHCPICHEEMEVNLRKDDTFVEDELWNRQSEKYVDFIESNEDKKVLLLEFGVGFNTPTIIRFPFEKMVGENDKWKLVRFNKVADTYYDMGKRYISIKEDIGEFFNR